MINLELLKDLFIIASKSRIDAYTAMVFAEDKVFTEQNEADIPVLTDAIRSLKESEERYNTIGDLLVHYPSSTL